MSVTPGKYIKEAIENVWDALAKADENKVIEALAKLGITVKNPDGSFKIWGDIFAELSEILNKQTSN